MSIEFILIVANSTNIQNRGEGYVKDQVIYVWYLRNDRPDLGLVLQSYFQLSPCCFALMLYTCDFSLHMGKKIHPNQGQLRNFNTTHKISRRVYNQYKAKPGTFKISPKQQQNNLWIGKFSN